ncbi:amino acid ABC transporter permease [Streptomyces sp. NPDC056159]|uniref:amino acid ABC transporter permease n=1 Tax=unclassified Streptomyces TaxID=2593676 RepID=UPI0034192D93
MSSPAPTVEAKPAGQESDPVVPARHPGRWLALLTLAVLAAMALHLLVTNERLEWPVVWQYLFSEPILTGVARTLELTGIAMVMGLVIGIVVAIGRLSPNPVLSKVAWLYSWFFRGTPLLVQLLFWFYLSALLPRISIGIPFGPELASAGTNSLITPFLAATLGLGLNEGAYMSEIVRSGILAVPRGQTEAGQAIGMSRGQVMRRVVLPQAMRVIIPPTGNETIGMLKYTSLVLVIGYAELLTSASLIYSRTFQTIPLLIVAALWYLTITAVLSVAQYYVERHFGRGFQVTASRRTRPSRLLRARPAVPVEATTSLRSAS